MPTKLSAPLGGAERHDQAYASANVRKTLDTTKFAHPPPKREIA